VDGHARVWVAGAGTPMGRALVRALARRARVVGAGADPDFTDPAAVEAAFEALAPDYVVVAAGRAGGIGLNQRAPAGLMRENLLVAAHVLEAAHRRRVRKLLYLASSCVYPRDCGQPMREDALLTGPLEPTSAPYALAKLAGLTLCQAYRRERGSPFVTAIAGDSFGPDDVFDPDDAHVVGALIGRMHRARVADAPVVEVWGTGTPRRDFVFADDLAEACLCVLEGYDDPAPINLGGGGERSIAELAALIGEVVGYRGAIRFDPSRPDGAPRKALDGRRLAALGWRPRTPLRQALEITYRSFLESERAA
jgi:GDP-L-fucose synthase